MSGSGSCSGGKHRPAPGSPRCHPAQQGRFIPLRLPGVPRAERGVRVQQASLLQQDVLGLRQVILLEEAQHSQQCLAVRQLRGGSRRTGRLGGDPVPVPHHIAAAASAATAAAQVLALHVLLLLGLRLHRRCLTRLLWQRRHLGAAGVYSPLRLVLFATLRATPQSLFPRTACDSTGKRLRQGRGGCQGGSWYYKTEAIYLCDELAILAVSVRDNRRYVSSD
ncbi:hypothetical protein FKM82_029907 [Ascaphus truei]